MTLFGLLARHYVKGGVRRRGGNISVDLSLLLYFILLYNVHEQINFDV